MIIQYLFVGIALLIVLATPVGDDFKAQLFLTANTMAWLLVAAFWIWVYVQASIRKILINKIVKILVAVSAVAVFRGVLIASGIYNPVALTLPTFVLGLIVLLETNDLWIRAGREVDNIDKVDTDRD